MYSFYSLSLTIAFRFHFPSFVEYEATLEEGPTTDSEHGGSVA
jgi:hypothetical protein